MKRKILLVLAALSIMVGSQAHASALVTSDVPVDSKYYQYIDKMEAMGFITDMPGDVKPYSRLTVAKMLAKVNPEGMQPYLKVYYDEMVENFSDEIAYCIAHYPLPNIQRIDAAYSEKELEFHEAYYAHKYNDTVAQKVEMAKQSKHFPSNVKFRSIGVEFSGQQMDQRQYQHKGHNSSYQPLHTNNQGYRYADGFNAVGTMTIDGSINNDLAVSVTPRVSYNKEDNGKVSLKEGYVTTHLGNLKISAGKEAIRWGNYLGGALAISDNATSRSMISLGLLEPWDTKDTFVRFLGKVDFNVFVAKMESDRQKRAQLAGYSGWKKECDHMKLIGLRMDITPNDTFTFGFTRVSMLKDINKDWLFGTNADHDDQWDDIGGGDFRLKFPGIQVYGSFYGEDQAQGLPCKWAWNAGMYLPQVAKDGSWDARLELGKNNTAWYKHSPFINGWTYKGDVMGDAMGRNAYKINAEINNYMSNGDKLSFRYMNTDSDRSYANNPKYSEYQINYDKKLSNAMHLDTAVGYASIKNADYTKGRKDKAKYMSVGVKWNF